MIKSITKDKLRTISTSELFYLLHNSTIAEDDRLYVSYVYLIDNGDLIEKYDLYTILNLSQRNMFYEGDILSVKTINQRLDFIMLDDKY